MNQFAAGPELDQLVAEAIWPYCTVGMCAASGCGLVRENDADLLAVWKANDERTWIPLPHFSTDWNAAMSAAEATFGERYLVEFTECYWTVEFEVDGKWREFDSAPTGPLAICQAILAMTGTNYLST